MTTKQQNPADLSDEELLRHLEGNADLYQAAEDRVVENSGSITPKYYEDGYQRNRDECMYTYAVIEVLRERLQGQRDQMAWLKESLDLLKEATNVSKIDA